MTVRKLMLIALLAAVSAQAQVRPTTKAVTVNPTNFNLLFPTAEQFGRSNGFLRFISSDGTVSIARSGTTARLHVDIPDVSEFLTQEDADLLYQPIVGEGGFLTQDTADGLYQPLGDYATGDFVRVETDAAGLAAAASVQSNLMAASNALRIAVGAVQTNIATTNEPLWTAASNRVLYVGDIAETAYGTETNTAYRGDWGASVSNLAAQAAGWGDHAAADYLRVESPAEQAYIKWDGSDWVSEYGVRASMLASEAVAAHGAGILGTLWPGQLLTLDIVVDGIRHCYVVTNELDTSAFAPEDTTWLPLGDGDVFWKEFVRQGRTGLGGAAGKPGDDGLDGVGNIQYGVWDHTKAYLYDTGTPIVVSYAGRWYDCVASSTNKPPTAVGATNYWAISVDKGADGEIVGWTNLVFRGNWNSGDGYTTNDAVWWQGNLFAVSETNSAPPLGTAPSAPAPSYEGLDTAYWTCLLSRGVQGAKGARGDDGNTINSYTVYTLFNTNSLFAMYPAASAGYRLPIWKSSGSASTTMVWSAVVPVGTNNLSASNGMLYFNGLEYGRGKTNVLELRTEELDADLVLRPDGAGGVKWGEEYVSGGIHSRLTAATNGSGAAYVWPASSAWWRVDADNTITGIVPVVDGAGITGDDLLLLGIEISRGDGVDFSWGGGDAPLAGVTNEVPANEISLHGLWRPSGGTNWVGF